METKIRFKIQINLFKNFSYTYSKASKTEIIGIVGSSYYQFVRIFEHNLEMPFRPIIRPYTTY